MYNGCISGLNLKISEGLVLYSSTNISWGTHRHDKKGATEQVDGSAFSVEREFGD
jgi:hypothetical protein